MVPEFSHSEADRILLLTCETVTPYPAGGWEGVSIGVKTNLVAYSGLQVIPDKGDQTRVIAALLRIESKASHGSKPSRSTKPLAIVTNWRREP